MFEGKPVNLAVADASIGPFIQTAPDGITWCQSFETLLDLIDSRRDTGNGPDGLVNGLYKTIPDAWKAVLYDLYSF